MNLVLSGKLACGKSVLANQLKNELDYEILSIGATIKSAANELIEGEEKFKKFIFEKIDSDEKLKTIVEKIIKEFKVSFNEITFKKDSEDNYIKTDEYRSLTQFIASTFRNELGEDFWVKLVSEYALKLSKEGRKVIVDDLRFPSEKEIFEKYYFKTIRINVSKEVQKQRINNRGDGLISEEQLNHLSETALDEEKFDLVINSDLMSMEEVKAAVFDYLKVK